MYIHMYVCTNVPNESLITCSTCMCIYIIDHCTLVLVQGLSLYLLFVLAHTSIVQLFGEFDFFICRSQLFFNINMIWKMNVSNCRTMHKSTINSNFFCSSPLNNGFGGFWFPQPHVCITLVVSRIKFIHGRFHSTTNQNAIHGRVQNFVQDTDDFCVIFQFNCDLYADVCI